MTISPSDLWPPAGLVVTAGDLTLTPVSDADLPGLVDLVLDGVHAPDRMPFTAPWTAVSSEELPARFARFHWGLRSTFEPGALHLDLAVRRDGVLVGVQGFGATDYPLLRTAETGSWLGQAHQGTGTGTRMRQAVCALLFDHLGARRVTSGAFVDNPASRTVSHKVGYVANGLAWVSSQGEERRLEHLLLEPGSFVRGEPVEVTGAGPLQRFLQVDCTPG